MLRSICSCLIYVGGLAKRHPVSDSVKAQAVDGSMVATAIESQHRGIVKVKDVHKNGSVLGPAAT